SSNTLRADGAIKVNVDVKNTGKRAGEEVIEMYVKHLDSKVERPLKELKGFARIPLHPGETKTITLELKGEQLAYWNTAQHRFMTENDHVQIMVGSSSANIKLNKTVRVIR